MARQFAAPRAGRTKVLRHSKSSSGGAQTMPKRTPHSELTSYQSEKRLKEYKQQQAQLQQQ